MAQSTIDLSVEVTETVANRADIIYAARKRIIHNGYWESVLTGARVMVKHGYDDWRYLTQYASGTTDWESPPDPVTGTKHFRMVTARGEIK